MLHEIEKKAFNTTIQKYGKYVVTNYFNLEFLVNSIKMSFFSDL